MACSKVARDITARCSRNSFVARAPLRHAPVRARSYSEHRRTPQARIDVPRPGPSMPMLCTPSRTGSTKAAANPHPFERLSRQPLPPHELHPPSWGDTNPQEVEEGSFLLPWLLGSSVAARIALGAAGRTLVACPVCPRQRLRRRRVRIWQTTLPLRSRFAVSVVPARSSPSIRHRGQSKLHSPKPTVPQRRERRDGPDAG